MSRPNLQIIHVDAPLPLEAIRVTAEFVGLGKLTDAAEYGVFFQFAPVGADELARILHVSIDNARFLRDSIDYALEQYRVRTCENN
jgi:hypothetical protein